MKIKITDNSTDERYQVELDIFKEPLTPLRIENYSEKAFAVFGSTKEFKDLLLASGGGFYHNLNGSPGWTFSKRRLGEVQKLVRFINKIIDNGEISFMFSGKSKFSAELLGEDDLRIVPRSPRSFHLIGNTDLFEDELVSLKCQKVDSDGRRAVWRFPKSKFDAVYALVSVINKLR